MDRKHLAISCTKGFKNVSLTTFSLLDTGATGGAFVDKNYTRLHSLPLEPLQSLRIIKVIDGHPIHSRAVTPIARRGQHINGQEAQAPFLVTSLGD